VALDRYREGSIRRSWPPNASRDRRDVKVRAAVEPKRFLRRAYTSSMLRLGIAGCGWAGQRHCEAAADDDRVAVTALADADADTLADRAGEWGVEATFEDYAAMYERADLDAVVVALPHHLHEDAVVEAARAGMDVLCEKPVARTVAEADAMLDAADRHGVALVVAESARYEPWVRRVEEAVDDGAVGEPVFASFNWLHDFGGYRYDRAAWLNDAERLGGGQWHLNGVHIVSPLRGWFAAGGAGDVEAVFAREFRTPEFDAPEGIEASVHATLAFESGASADVSMGLEVHDDDRFDDVRIVGTDGSIRVDADRSRVDVYRGDRTETVDAGDGDAFEIQMAAFLDTVLDGRPSRTAGVRERDTLAVVEAGYESMETGTSADVHRRGE